MNNTPKNRYSCISEYATPKGSDDSDNSLYFSFVASEDENSLYKENSISGSQNTNVPLLRTVLQANCTPRNKINKRVSFQSSPKSNKTRECQLQSYNIKEAQPTAVAPLKTIKESQATKLRKNEMRNFVQKNGKEHTLFNDSASDVTDDLENELQDTIIENTINTLLPSSVQSINLAGTAVDVYEQDGKNEKTLSQSSKKFDTKNVKDVSGVHTNNVIKQSRQLLAYQSRKSILPPKRATNYKRRSSIYEPHKVLLRKSLITKSKQGKKLIKCITYLH